MYLYPYLALYIYIYTHIHNVLYIQYTYVGGYALCSICPVAAPSSASSASNQPRVQELIVLDGPIHVHIHTGEPETAVCAIFEGLPELQHAQVAAKL